MTISTVGYGDIIPTNNEEVLYTVIMIVLGSIFYSIFISVVANFFKTIDRTNIKINNYKGILYLIIFYYDLDSIEHYRRMYSIPNKVVYEIIDYFSTRIKGKFYRSIASNLENNLSKKIKFDDILKMFPKNIKLEVLMFMYKDAIQKIKFLKGRDSQFYANILPKLIPVKVK